MKRSALFLLMTATLHAPLSAQTFMQFAQFAIGGGYKATLIMSNLGTAQGTWQVWVKRWNNARWATPWYVNGQYYMGYDYVLVTIPSYGTTRLVFEGDEQTRAGYLKITAMSGTSNSNLLTSYFYTYVDATGRTLTMTGSGPSLDVTSGKVVFPVEVRQGVDTGYALCPYVTWGETSTSLRIRLYDANGEKRHEATMTYEGHIAEFVSQRFGVKEFMGLMEIEQVGNWYLGLEVLRMEYGPGWFLLTNVPQRK